MATIHGKGPTFTPTRTVATTSGTVSAGANRVTFVSSADFSGTVLGAAFPASASETIPAPENQTLDTLGYTVTTGSLTITQIR